MSWVFVVDWATSRDLFARGTSRAAASAIARSTCGSRVVYVSEVMPIEEWPSISLIECRSAPAA
ncbi:hypothetical protein [Kitasatospora aureofaciens]|uniref:hypothetical protein n=1 Tax=Kitasatospora aureofaciens TaxID=1894 RepID=UPI003F4CEA99